MSAPGVDLPGIQVASSGLDKGGASATRRLPGDDIDGSACGAIAIEHRAAIAHDLDPFDAPDRDGAVIHRGEIDIVEAPAIEQYP